jgi:glc operon protein GlcG
MLRPVSLSLTMGAALVAGATTYAQQPPTASLDTIPEKMPFSQPYGPPINSAHAMSLVQAAATEATRKGWAMNIAVVDSGANLVAFLRMDGAQLASIAIAEHKARSSVKFRRPTRAFEDAIQKNDYKYMATLDDVVASRGGIPLLENGKIIGAIGCSGGSGSQDEAVCTAAAGDLAKSGP